MNDESVVEAINDLARIMIAFQGIGSSKSESVRRLHAAGVKQAKIASLLLMATKDVTSLVSKLRKSDKGGRKASNRA
jgi:hypothetical protein